jgi:toxin ParE1/3/4
MAKFQLTNNAVEDLTSIWDYTCDNWSEYQADKYYQILVNCFNEILINPNIGKNYFGIADNLKGFRVGKHVVFYQVIDNDDLLVVRILHERMDLKNRKKDK